MKTSTVRLQLQSKMHFTRLVALLVALILLLVTQNSAQHVHTTHKNFSRSPQAKPTNAYDVKANNSKLAETETPQHCACCKSSTGSEMQHTHVVEMTSTIAQTKAVEHTTPATESSINSEKLETFTMTVTKSKVDSNDKTKANSVSGSGKSKKNGFAHTLVDASNSTRVTEIKNLEHINTNRKRKAEQTKIPQFQLVQIV